MEHWYCIYTKTNHEDQVCRRILDLSGTEVFSPKLKKRKFVRGKYQEVVEELFPCYVFSRFDPFKYYHMIKYTRGIKKVIGDESGNPYIVDEEIIDQIRSMIFDGFLQLETNQFNLGDNVAIEEGPFAGLTGIFMKDVASRDRVLILLNTIAYQARVEVEKEFLTMA